MRHIIKAGKVGLFTTQKQTLEIEQLEDREVAEEVEELEKDSEFSNDDEALEVIEFYDIQDEMK